MGRHVYHYMFCHDCSSTYDAGLYCLVSDCPLLVYLVHISPRASTVDTRCTAGNLTVCSYSSVPVHIRHVPPQLTPAVLPGIRWIAHGYMYISRHVPPLLIPGCSAGYQTVCSRCTSARFTTWSPVDTGPGTKTVGARCTAARVTTLPSVDTWPYCRLSDCALGYVLPRASTIDTKAYYRMQWAVLLDTFLRMTPQWTPRCTAGYHTGCSACTSASFTTLPPVCGRAAQLGIRRFDHISARFGHVLPADSLSIFLPSGITHMLGSGP